MSKPTPPYILSTGFLWALTFVLAVTMLFIVVVGTAQTREKTNSEKVIVDALVDVCLIESKQTEQQCREQATAMVSVHTFGEVK